MKWRTPTALVAATAMAIGLIVSPIFSATANETNTEQVYLRCDADVSISNSALNDIAKGLIANYLPYDMQTPLALDVTAPSEVSVGEEFEIEITSSQAIGDGTAGTVSLDLDELLASAPVNVSLSNAFLSRVKLDITKPSGTELVSAQISGDTTGLFDDAEVITVNNQGQRDPNGDILRIVDGANTSVGNANNTGTGRGGLTYDLPGNAIEFQIPTITLKLRATETNPNATLGLREPTTGAASDAVAGFASAGARALFIRANITAPVYCGPTPAGTSVEQDGGAPITVPQDNAQLASFSITDSSTTTALTASSSLQVGVPAEFTATVPQGIEGSVTFSGGGQKVTSPVDPETGQATGELTFAQTGDVEVTATFNPTTPGRDSSTATETFTVDSRSAQLSIDVPAESNVCRPTPVSATVDPATAGTVSFRIGDGESVSADVDPETGQATAELVFTETGSQEVSAEFVAEDSNFAPARASATVLVGSPDNSVELELPASASFNQPATVEAIVPTGVEGTVTFASGAQNVEAAVDPETGRASAELTFTSLGQNNVTATFTPTTPGYSQVQTARTIQVVSQATNVTVDGPAAVEVGQEFTVTATVDPAVAGTATFVLGNQRVPAQVDPETGIATATLSAHAAGAHTIQVRFAAEQAGVSAATAQHEIEFTQAEGTLTLQAPEGSVFQNVPADYIVQLPQGAQGTVTFTAGDRSVSAAVDPSTGQAIGTLSIAEPGNINVTATFEPTVASAVGPASTSTTVEISTYSGTQVVLDSLPATIRPGDRVDLRATVIDSDTATNSNGRMRFTFGDQTVVATVIEGVATATLTASNAGTVEVTASYEPSLNNGQEAATTTATVAVVEVPAPTATVTATDTGLDIGFDLPVNGTARVLINGVEAGTAPVEAGNARLDVDVPEGEVDVVVEFTPADAREAAPSRTNLALEVEREGAAIENLNVAMNPSATSGQTDEAIAVRIEVNEPVTGHVTLTNNGELVLGMDDQPVRVPMTDGIADIDVTWLDSRPNEKELAATVVLEDGTVVGTDTKTFTITGADVTEEDGATMMVLQTPAHTKDVEPVETPESDPDSPHDSTADTTDDLPASTDTNRPERKAEPTPKNADSPKPDPRSPIAIMLGVLGGVGLIGGFLAVLASIVPGIASFLKNF